MSEKDLARLKTKIQISETGCWLWTGYVSERGYGRIGARGKTVSAHRWTYNLFKGEIPEGLDLDHLCRVRHCVNPDHLEAVTRSENTIRGAHPNRMKTHCLRGHPFDLANTVRPYKKNPTWRRCQQCKKEAHRSTVLNPDAVHQALRTHCPKGHPYEGENLIIRIKDGRKWRGCRECRREECRRSRLAKAMLRTG